MPLAQRAIEPVYLGRRPLREEETKKELVQVAVTHNALLGTLVQLASLVRHADDLFCDLADECQAVFDHTEKIIHRVKRIKEGVARLDSKKVAIPVGDLKRFSTVQDHHVAQHGFHCSFFCRDNRPHCIKARYSVCEVTPVGALRGADLFRKDGLHSSNQFKLWPILLREHEVKTDDMNIPRRRGQAMTFSKKYKRLKPRPRTIHSVESLDSLRQEAEEANPGSDPSITATSTGLSKSQPSILVAVDTSGTGFHRMSSFRQSLKGTASLDRKKRRRTVSGVPDNIMQEIEHFERGRRASRSTPRDYSFDDLDFKKEPDREALMLQYLDEIDAKMEERAEQERATREVKLLKFLPCRRSRSLPRCVKVGASQCRGVMVFEQDDGAKDKDRSIVTATTSGYGSSSLSLGSAGGSSTSSRTTKRSSIISNKIKSFVQGTLRPRPKSCDFDAIDVLGNDSDGEEESTANKANLKRKFSPSMPDDIMSLSSSRESQVGPGTYYYFNSSTLPRAQARKYDFPWDSLPKDWTTAVKLREISKRRREERNSSSGNWSGSSNRQSLDSARSSNLPSSASQHSLGRDSGRGSPSVGDDKSGTDAGHFADHTGSDSVMSTFLPLGATASKDSRQDTEQWLASLAKRAAAREDAAKAGSEVTESLTRLSQLTKQNILALEESISPGLQRPLRLDDEVSSVYSLDQEGFYTSFHNDSGLRRSSGTLLEEEDGAQTPVKETLGGLNLGSNNTVDSVIFCPQSGEDSDAASSSTPKAKVRPPPPARSGSRLSSTSSLSDSITKSESTSSVLTVIDSYAGKDGAAAQEIMVVGESSQSESDQEMIYARLKAKTRISRHTIPSWCSVSDEDSTDTSSINLSALAPPDGASVSFSGSPSKEEMLPSTSTPLSNSATAESESKGKEATGTVWKGSTLPRHYLESKVWDEESSEYTANSWPRSRRDQQALPSAGILKRDKSPAGSLKPKTLNFAPVVSLFDESTAQGLQLPLAANSSTSSSSSVEGSSDAADSGPSYKVSMPLLHSTGSIPSQVDKKYQPTITIKPGQVGDARSKPSQIIYPHTLVKAGPLKTVQHYAVAPVKGMNSVSAESSDRSTSSSESSIPSLSDCGRGGYLDMSGVLSHRNQDTLSSSSSACLSDIDSSSLTYVSMSSPNSTPTNSTLNLGPDGPDSATPVNSPVHECDTYRISSVTLSNGQGVTQSAGGPCCIPESGPVLQAPSLPSPLVSQPAEGGKMDTSSHRQLSSFSANASTEAAPSSWIGEKVAGRFLHHSGVVDSGFSSPTTPTNLTSKQHGERSQGLPHSESWPQASEQFTVHPNPEVNWSHSLRTGGGESGTKSGLGNVRKFRTSAPPDQLFLEKRHEPLKAMHSLGSSADQSAPRSDSYRVAMTTEFARPRSHSRERGSSSVKARAQPGRSHSSSQMSSSHAHSYHPGMTKSLSCPTGSLGDTDMVNRADSYRIAVRNTQGIVGDMATRNTSYRMATGEDDFVPDARMDAVNLWGEGPRRVTGSRDVRRMGITDIDQLKCYDSDSSNHSMSSRASSSSAGGPASKTFAGINSSRKKMKPEVQNLLLSNKSPSPQAKRMSKISGKSSKDKDKSKTQSSTYIRFDPIFEDRDDMYSSSDTLRAESVEMLASEDGFLMGHQVVSKLPPGKFKGTSSGGRKPVDEKAVTSILDSIKTTIKSMSSRSSADKDMWRYEGGI